MSQAESLKEVKEKVLLRKLIEEEGTTIESVARAIGKSRSALSRYLNNDYPPTTIEPLIKDYLIKVGYWQYEDQVRPEDGWIKDISEIDVMETSDMTRVWGVCRVCYAGGDTKKAEMGVITGEPGTGKTVSLSSYKEFVNSKSVIVTCDATSTKKSILSDTAEALDINCNGTAATLMRRIVKHLKKQPQLIIYDEADLMKNPVLFETIRAIHDKAKVGIVLSGNHVLSERILFYAEERSELARLRDRIGYTVRLQGITKDETKELLRKVNATHGARQMLITIGEKRGIRQLVKALGRLLDVTQGDRIDESLVEELGQIVLSFNA